MDIVASLYCSRIVYERKNIVKKKMGEQGAQDAYS
jgi:hypothetical protein